MKINCFILLCLSFNLHQTCSSIITEKGFGRSGYRDEESKNSQIKSHSTLTLVWKNDAKINSIDNDRDKDRVISEKGSLVIDFDSSKNDVTVDNNQNNLKRRKRDTDLEAENEAKRVAREEKRRELKQKANKFLNDVEKGINETVEKVKTFAKKVGDSFNEIFNNNNNNNKSQPLPEPPKP